MLHEKYNVGLPFASFSGFLRQAEHAVVQSDARHKIGSPDIRAAIFFWASSTINVKDIPTLDEFAQDNSMLSKRLAPTIKLLAKKCNTLKSKLVEAAKNSSRPSSPTKSLLQASSPRTPRRSPTKPFRELPTRESVKKQRQAQTIQPETEPLKTKGDAVISDAEMASPETPTKKRKLDTSSPTSLSKKRMQFPPVTPVASHITHLASPTKTKINPTPAVPSPLRRSARFVLQQEADASMEVDDDEEDVPVDVNRILEFDLAKVGNETDEDLRGERLVTRRFRPVYQDYRQWFTRDARVVRIWKEANDVQ